MAKIDDLIDEVLSEEEENLLEHYGKEPGYFRQAIGLFRGPLAWVVWFVYIVQVLTFAGFVYAAWHFFNATEVLAALQWGVGAILLLMFTVFGKGFMGGHLEANRVLREVKRLELRLIRLEGDGQGPKS